MNYYLHNNGYNKPINFREVVLKQYQYRYYWLYDTSLSQLGLYDYKKWLPDIEYEERELQRELDRLQEYKAKRASLTDEKLREMYEAEVEKIKQSHQCNEGGYGDMIQSVKVCADNYKQLLDKWLEVSDSPQFLVEALFDIYETALGDMEQWEEAEAETIERAHNRPIPSYDDFKKNELTYILGEISRCEGWIRSKKRNIAILKEHAEEIKQIFAWLDAMEQEEQNQ